MKIIEKIEDKNLLRIIVDSNEESLFFLLKQYLSNNSQVDIVGVYKEHYLVSKTELLIKVKKGNAKDVLKKTLTEIKKDLNKKKVK
ncbi:MAG: RpoL/Rpb11 RNA polymerase subunit family protein [Nanoarchaeota archaeon]